MDSLKKKINIETRRRLNEENYNLYEQIEQSNKQELDVDFDFIRHNPSSPICVEILYQKVSDKSSALVNMYDTFSNMYSSLSQPLKDSYKGKLLAQQLNNWKNSSVGSTAPDFTMEDINKEQVSLHSYRNKNYILIDFWASWCGPCRHDIPHLKELYHQYNEKGLEIISISADNDVSAWMAAVGHDGTQIWKQIAVARNNNDVLNQYYSRPIPLKVLVNKQGKIIGRWLGSGKENDDELNNKLEEAFK